MPARLKPAAARAQIASGALEPLYVIVGDDEAEKTGLVAAFGDAIDPELRPFNVDRLYGAETTMPVFFDAVRTLPVLAPRRVVVVLQADRLFAPKRDSAAAQKDLEALEAFVTAPEAHATVVFVADALDGRRTLTKLLYRNAVVIECGGLNDAAEAEHWVRARVGEQGMNIEPAAVRLLVERGGLDVGRLRGEIERVCLFAAGRTTVTTADVREVAGAATSQDDWAMVNAMRDGNAALALRELSLLFDAGGMALPILGQLRSFIERGMAPGRQAKAFDALLRTDLALKTSAGDPQILLERLIVELCEGI
jgi:DNA polymerase-3 subunit delta